MKKAPPPRTAVAGTAKADIDGDFIMDKMDETRENGKVVSWSVELKPTFTGRALTLGSSTGGTAA